MESINNDTIHLDDLLAPAKEPIEAEETDKVEVTTIKAEKPKSEEQQSTVITPKTSNVDLNKTANIENIAKFQEKVDPMGEFYEKESKLIDEHIERTKKDMTERLLNPIKEKCIEIAEQKEMEAMAANTASDEELLENKSSDDDLDEEVKPASKKEAESDDDIFKDDDTSIDEDDISDDDEEDNKKSEEERRKEAEELLAKFREQGEEIGKALRGDEVDLSKFSIGNIPINVNKTIKNIKERETSVSTASVALFSTGRMATFSALSGTELALLAEKMTADTRNGTSTGTQELLSLLFKHDVSEDKPTPYVKWLRSIDSEDLNHMVFGLYQATFGKANYVSFECEKCGSFFMVDMDINDMRVIGPNAKEEDKERLQKIEKLGKLEEESKEKTVQISPDYAIIIKPFTLLNMLESTRLDQDFLDKYAEVLQISQFISKVLYIDREHGMLRPLDMKPDNSSIMMTLKHKIQVISKFVKQLTPDEYSYMRNVIADTDRDRSRGSRDIYEYRIPEQPCLGTFKKGEHIGEKCTYKFDKIEMAPLNMLFTRHQLGARSI